jgi:hypothetical protein
MSEPSSRARLPEDAGMNSLQLDLELTRDELAHTLDDLFAKFNLRLIISSRPVVFAGSFVFGLAACAVFVSSRLRRRASRGR